MFTTYGNVKCTLPFYTCFSSFFSNEGVERENVALFNILYVYHNKNEMEWNVYVLSHYPFYVKRYKKKNLMYHFLNNPLVRWYILKGL